MDKTCTIYDGKMNIKYILTRSNRKSVGITIKRSGEVRVTAPFSASEKQIEQIIVSKASWLEKKQEEIRQINKLIENKRQFKDSEKFLYLGNEYTLRIKRIDSAADTEVTIKDGSIIVAIPKNLLQDQELLHVKHTLKNWYIDRFAEIIRERINLYAKNIGVVPIKVTIREQKSRWGSCSGKGSINLNWKLIMAPLEVLDYVIVHELCHVKEMNHSQKFWSLVEGVLPNSSECRKWLKMNGCRLEL